MEDNEDEDVLVLRRGSSVRSLKIHVPAFLPRRKEVVQAIRDNGGKIEAKLTEADLILLEDDVAFLKQAQSVFDAHRRETPIIKIQWLWDTVQSGIIQATRSAIYHLDRLSEARRQLHLTRSSIPLDGSSSSWSRNERRPRNGFTAEDEDDIVTLLSVLPEHCTLHRAAHLLSKLSSAHSQASYTKHLQENMDRGKRYACRAKHFSQRQGARLTELKASLYRELPELKSLFAKSVCHSSASSNSASSDEVSVSRHGSVEKERVYSSSIEANFGRASKLKDSESEDTSLPQVAGPQRQDSSQDATTASEVHADVIERVPTDKQPIFTKAHRRTLVQHLSVYLQSIIKEQPASQGSIVGYIDCEEDRPNLPGSFFQVLSGEIPVHSPEAWRLHYGRRYANAEGEEMSNSDLYLQLAKEQLEKMRVDAFLGLPSKVTNSSVISLQRGDASTFAAKDLTSSSEQKEKDLSIFVLSSGEAVEDAFDMSDHTIENVTSRVAETSTLKTLAKKPEREERLTRMDEESSEEVDKLQAVSQSQERNHDGLHVGVATQDLQHKERAAGRTKRKAPHDTDDIDTCPRQKDKNKCKPATKKPTDVSASRRVDTAEVQKGLTGSRLIADIVDLTGEEGSPFDSVLLCTSRNERQNRQVERL